MLRGCLNIGVKRGKIEDTQFYFSSTASVEELDKSVDITHTIRLPTLNQTVDKVVDVQGTALQ